MLDLTRSHQPHPFQVRAYHVTPPTPDGVVVPMQTLPSTVTTRRSAERSAEQGDGVRSRAVPQGW